MSQSGLPGALYLNTADLSKALADGSVRLTKGDAKELANVFDLFDHFQSARDVRPARPED